MIMEGIVKDKEKEIKKKDRSRGKGIVEAVVKFRTVILFYIVQSFLSIRLKRER